MKRRSEHELVKLTFRVSAPRQSKRLWENANVVCSERGGMELKNWASWFSIQNLKIETLQITHNTRK